MRTRTYHHVALPLAAVALLPVSLAAQDPFAQPDSVSEAALQLFEKRDPSAVDSLVTTEQALRAEIEALEAASAQRRAELEKRLRNLAEQRQRAAREMARRNSLDLSGLPISGMAAPPRWLIGVQVAPGTSDGVSVQRVLPDTPAARAGLESGDAIEAVNRISVRDVNVLNAIINAAGDQELTLRIRRGEKRIEKKIKPTREVLQPVPGGAEHSGLFDGGGGGSAGGAGLLRPPTPTPAPRGQWREMRPRAIPTPRGGPDTAEIQSLKGEIRELREMLQDLASSLSDGHAEGEIDVFADEEEEGEAEEEDADLTEAPVDDH